MPVQLICTSHSPLIGYADSGMPSPGCAEAFYGLMSSLAEQVAAFVPELVLVFAPDHFNGFYYEVMPPFCIGADGEGAGDFGGPTGRLTIDGSLAKDLANHALAHGFDPAFSYGMRLDHGFLQPLSLLFRSEEHTSELQSLMRISYAVFCLTKKKKQHETKQDN